MECMKDNTRIVRNTYASNEQRATKQAFKMVAWFSEQLGQEYYLISCDIE